MTVLRAAVVRTEGECEMSPPVKRSLHATGGGWTDQESRRSTFEHHYNSFCFT